MWHAQVWSRVVVVHSLIQQRPSVSSTGPGATRKKAAVDKEEHFKLLRASGAKVNELLEALQRIRDQEAALQAERVKKLEELKKARAKRLEVMTAAINDKVPKTQIARELGMDRTNLYKLLEGKDESVES